MAENTSTTTTALSVVTLTINDTLAIFREFGVPMSYEKLTAMIKSGQFSHFAYFCRKGGRDDKAAGNDMYLIFKKPLMSWLMEMAVPAGEAAK